MAILPTKRHVDTTTECPDCQAEIDIVLEYDVVSYDEHGPIYAKPKLALAKLFEDQDDGCHCGHSPEKLIQIAEDQLQADAEAADERRSDGR